MDQSLAKVKKALSKDVSKSMAVGNRNDFKNYETMIDKPSFSDKCSQQIMGNHHGSQIQTRNQKFEKRSLSLMLKSKEKVESKVESEVPINKTKNRNLSRIYPYAKFKQVELKDQIQLQSKPFWNLNNMFREEESMSKMSDVSQMLAMNAQLRLSDVNFFSKNDSANK